MNKGKISLLNAAGSWKTCKESGLVYERRIRAGWKKRLNHQKLQIKS